MIEIRGGEELRRITRGLKQLEDGKVLRRHFVKELRAAAKPVVPAVRAAIRAIPSHSRNRGATRLRSRLSRATTLKVRTSGKQAGIVIRVDGRKMPAGQGSLPALMEGNKRPWRHPVYDDDVWVKQDAHPYFDVTVRKHAAAGRAAINKVVNDLDKLIT